MRNALAGSFLAAGLVIAALIAGGPAVAAGPQLHTITVSGEGEVKGVPDQALLTAGVVTQAATAADALASNRRAMNAVFAELKRQGIPDRALQTSDFNVSPQYAPQREEGDTRPRIVGYQVSNSVAVTVDDLQKLGPAIDALVASGANSMGGVTFAIRDPKPLLRQAREAAVKDAMDRAQTYAKAAGLVLGRIVNISEGGAQAPHPVFRAMAFDGADKATPIAAGEQTVSAQVTVTFEIR
jgi:uncharacterized protein